MKQSIAALFIILSSYGCASKPYDLIPQSGTLTRSITWVMADDPAAMCDAAYGAPLIGKRLACAKLDGSRCIIYVKPPRDEDDRRAIYALGHEALHCFAGHFHFDTN